MTMIYCQFLAIIASGLSPTRVTLIKEDTNDILIYVPIVSGEKNWAVYRMHKQDSALPGWGAASNVWVMAGISVLQEDGTEYSLSDANVSAFEYAYRIGLATDTDPADYDYFGSVHQAETKLTFALILDGVSLTESQIPSRYQGDTIVFSQTMLHILPKDKTTVVGDGSISHTFEIAATHDVEVEHLHTYYSTSLYNLCASYSAMLPTTDTDSLGCDTYKIGSNPSATRVYDDGAYNVGTEEATHVCSHSAAHPWKIEMTLPYGGPDSSGLWTYSGNWGTWFQDRSTAVGKVYVNWYDSDFADRAAPPASSSHKTRYRVYS